MLNERGAGTIGTRLPVAVIPAPNLVEVLCRARRSGASLGDGLCLAVTECLNLPVTGGDQLWAELPLTVQFMPFRR